MLLRRRFMVALIDGYVWLKAILSEKLKIKSSISSAPTVPVEIDNKHGDINVNINPKATNVSDLEIDKTLRVLAWIAPYARLRRDPVHIRDIQINEYFKAIVSPAKVCRYIKTVVSKRVSYAIMCLTRLLSYYAETILTVSVKPKKADAVQPEVFENISSEYLGSAIMANTVETSSEENILGVNNVSFIGADTPDISIAEKTKDNIYAKMFCWCNAILEDGVLTIYQAVESTQTEDILAIDLWINPSLNNEVLTIKQVYDVNQITELLEVE